MDNDRVFAKCAWRLIPFMALLYVISFIDRSNVGYAALTMNKDLGFSPVIFGFGAGVFFVGYALFQMPANLILERIGARRWIFCILAMWGLLSASNALVRSPLSFYTVRFLLGVAEAGFFPGMLLYLTYWFSRATQARVCAGFMAAIPLSYAIGGPVSTLVLQMDGVAGIHGWQWLFLLEGLPAFLLSFAALGMLPDGPANASWLSADQKQMIATRLAAGDSHGKSSLAQALRDPRLFALGIANFTFQASAYGVALWLPQIVQAMGFSNRTTGFVVALPYAAGIAAMLICGRSSSIRNERSWHVAVSWLIAGLALLLASVVQANAIVLAALAIAVIANFAAYGPFFCLPSLLLRGAAAAGGIGYFNTLGSLGGFFGPSIIGVLKQGSGDYASGFIAVALGFMMSVLIVLAIGRLLAPRATVAAAPAV